MRTAILLSIVITAIGFVYGFEFDADSTTAVIEPGERADFEFNLIVPERIIDTLDIYLHNDIPDGWTATACTPWECFFEHASLEIEGPDTAIMTVHFITDSITSGTGIMWMVIQSRGTGQIDSIMFTVTAESYIAENKLPSMTSISLSPNPFNSVCRIEYNISGCGELDILNTDGKVVYRDNIVGSGILHWAPTNGHSGVYLVRIISNNGIVQKKSIYLK